MKFLWFSTVMLFATTCFGQQDTEAAQLELQRLKPVHRTVVKYPRMPRFAGPKGYVAPIAMIGIGPDGAFHYVKVDGFGNLGMTGGGGTLLGGPNGYVNAVAPVALGTDGTWQYLNIDAAGNLKTTGMARSLALSNVVISPPAGAAAANCTSGTNPFLWVLDSNRTYQSGGCIDDVNFLGFPSSKGHLNISRAIIFNPSGVTDTQGAHGNWWNGYNTEAGNSAGYSIQRKIENLDTDTTAYVQPMYQEYGETTLHGTATVGLEAGVLGVGYTRQRVDDYRTGGPVQKGFAVFDAVVSKQHAYANTGCTLASRQSCYVSFLGEVWNQVNEDHTDETYAAFESKLVFAGTNGTSYGYHAWKPKGLLGTNYAFASEDIGSGAGDYNFYSKGTATTGKNRFQGQVILDTHLNQAATGGFAGTCTMSSGTQCTFVINATYVATPGCLVTVQSSTVIAGGCTVSGTTVTITAAVSNSATWAAMLFGNPN